MFLSLETVLVILEIVEVEKDWLLREVTHVMQQQQTC